MLARRFREDQGNSDQLVVFEGSYKTRECVPLIRRSANISRWIELNEDALNGTMQSPAILPRFARDAGMATTSNRIERYSDT